MNFLTFLDHFISEIDLRRIAEVSVESKSILLKASFPPNYQDSPVVKNCYGRTESVTQMLNELGREPLKIRRLRARLR